MQYRYDRFQNPISILGYGCMRFTKKGKSIDLQKAEKEVMTAIHSGVNYLDTAYIYPGSEVALGKILAKNQCRDRVSIATKLPQYLIKSEAAIDRYFNEQLERLQTSYYRLLPDAYADGCGGLGEVVQAWHREMDCREKGRGENKKYRIFFSWQYSNVLEDIRCL